MDEARRVSARLPSTSSATKSARDATGAHSGNDANGADRADEASATAARERFRDEEMATLAPDPVIAPLLQPGERLLAIRRGVHLEYRLPTAGSGSADVGGDMYLTTARLVLLGCHTITIGLGDISEVEQSGSRLLLAMRDGEGMALNVDEPRLLRVEIATARAAARG